MKKRLNAWWYRKVILPYLLRHQPQCTVALKDAIVYQMWYAGIGYGHINKWLREMRQPTIKAYIMTGPNKDKVRLFYEYPDLLKRRELGRLTIIAQ